MPMGQDNRYLTTEILSSGIREGIAVLGNEPDGGSLLVVTDGGENTSPYISDVIDEVSL